MKPITTSQLSIKKALIATIGVAMGFTATHAEIPDVDLNLNENGWVIANNQSHSAAFDHLAYAMENSYPLAEWKGIDWDQTYDVLKPQVETALNNNDLGEYFRLVRRFAFTANDGHISVMSQNYEAFVLQPSFAIDEINASFGFTVTQLENQSYIIIVRDGSIANTSGLTSGMQILAIDDIPIAQYVASQPTDWTNLGNAHFESRNYIKGVRSGLGKMGEIRKVTFQTDTGSSDSIAIPAEPYEAPWFPGLSNLFEPANQAIFHDITDDNIGYLRVHAMITQKIIDTREESALLEFVSEINGQMDQAINDFSTSGVDELIIDLRGNSGGLDRIGAEILGYFIQDSQIYTDLVEFDFEEGEWDTDDIERQMAYPKSSTFDGRIVVLADLFTFSAAEGLLQALQRLPNCRFVGYWGSNGSYSETGGVAILPGEIVVQWPINPKIDSDGNIQIDTSADDTPTLLPDVRIPHLNSNAVSIFNEDDMTVYEMAKTTLRDPLFGFFPGSWVDEATGNIISPDYGVIQRWEKDPQVIFQKDLAWVRMLGRGGKTQTFHRNDWGECVTSPEIFPVIFSEHLGLGNVENGEFFPLNGDNS